MHWCTASCVQMEERGVLFSASLLLITGSLGQVTPQKCDLSFHLSVTNTSNNVKFAGFTASEKGDVGDNTVGSILTCSCSAAGLSPAKWLGPPGSAALNESFELTAGISYMLTLDQPGTAVQLHTTNNTFTCAEAGNYTCVIGENRRQVLVLPVGVECGLTNLTLTSSLNRRLAIGESIILQCSAVDPTGSGLSFQWFKDNLLIPGQSSSMLLLNVVGPSDIGTYACQVSNRLDKKSQAFYLSLFGVPEEQTATPIPAAGLTLEVLTTTVCFNKAVKLLCRHPDVLESGIFSTTRPSWKENGTVVALDGGMYRSAKQINETQVILELVPERSHFEPSGAHNYTCFLPLAGGGALESNLILIRPRDKPLKPKMLHSIPGIWDARIHWVNNNDDCFESQHTCSLEYNITWFAASGGSSYSETTSHPANEFTITGLRPDTEYTVTVKAQCQTDKSLSSQESMVSFRTEDRGNAALVLPTFNVTTCFGQPLFLHCHHPDTSSQIEGTPVFGSTRVHWKRDGAVIAVDGSTTYIASQNRNSTVLAVMYHRDNFRETTNNFSCFIPYEDGTVLQSNEVQVYLNVSYARLYNWTVFGKTLDWSHIVACSPLITPTTNFNVTVLLPSEAGVKRNTYITSNTSVELNLSDSLPHGEGISVSLQILEDEADTVNFTLTSSEMYACLGKTYKMNCTSTESFSRCSISTPCWFKDDKEFPCYSKNMCKTYSYGSQTEELSIRVPHDDLSAHVYYCAARPCSTHPLCPDPSNTLRVKPLSQPLCPEIQTFTSSETTLSFTWTHNKMCFTDCTTYNVSWRHVSKEKMLQNSTAVNETNCTIHDLMPGQNYTVQICAVCEGYNQTCTERKEYRTDPNPGTVDPGLSPGAIAGIVVAAVVVLLLVATTLGVLIGVCVVCKKRPVQEQTSNQDDKSVPQHDAGENSESDERVTGGSGDPE